MIFLEASTLPFNTVGWVSHGRNKVDEVDAGRESYLHAYVSLWLI